MGLPTSEQMPTSARIWHFRVYSGKSAKLMPTSLDAEFSTELGVGRNGGEKSATGTLTSKQLWPYRRRVEVDEPNADFRTMHALFIVGIGFADFKFFVGRTESLEVGEPVVDFGIFLGTVHSRRTDCRLQFKSNLS